MMPTSIAMPAAALACNEAAEGPDGLLDSRPVTFAVHLVQEFDEFGEASTDAAAQWACRQGQPRRNDQRSRVSSLGYVPGPAPGSRFAPLGSGSINVIIQWTGLRKWWSPIGHPLALSHCSAAAGLCLQRGRCFSSQE